MATKWDKEEIKRFKRVPEAMSVQLAAAIIDVSVMTIRRWIQQGYIKAYRVGPQLIRIPRSEVARMKRVRGTYLLHGDQPVYEKV